MNIISVPFGELTVDQLYKILQLRERVFVLEQECLYQDLDDLDQKAIHTFGMYGDRVIVCARTFWKDQEKKLAQIGRVVTDPDYRRQKKALEILKAAIDIAENEMKAAQIYLEAQTYAIPLYESLGFNVSSDVFLEDGIPHVQMIREVK